MLNKQTQITQNNMYWKWKFHVVLPNSGNNIQQGLFISV